MNVYELLWLAAAVGVLAWLVKEMAPVIWSDVRAFVVTDSASDRQMPRRFWLVLALCGLMWLSAPDNLAWAARYL